MLLLLLFVVSQTAGGDFGAGMIKYSDDFESSVEEFVDKFG